MKITDIIAEGVNDNFLYHHAKPVHFKGIIRDEKIRVASDEDDTGEYCEPGSICMTRNRKFGAYDRPIMIVIKKDALRQTHRVEPATYYLNKPQPQSNEPGAFTRIPKKDYYGSTSARGEEEERTWKDIPFTGKYIEMVVTNLEFPPELIQHLEQLGIPVKKVKKSRSK